MHTNNKRPVFLHLLRIHLPIGGVVSIIHRVSGVLLVLLVPLLVYLFDQANNGPRAYQDLMAAMRAPLGRVVLLVIAALTVQHLLSDLRHLLLDLEIGIDRVASARSAWATLAVTALLVGATGAWLW